MKLVYFFKKIMYNILDFNKNQSSCIGVATNTKVTI